MAARYVIVGNGAAGAAAAERIRERDPSGEVTIIAEETRPAYFRPLIPFLIDQSLPPEVLYRAPFPPGIAVHAGRRVAALNSDQKLVALDGGERLPYDRLLLATGASPYQPPITGLAAAGPLVLRRWEDAEAIRAAQRAGSGRALVVGAGRVGVKCALALRRLGLPVVVVEALARVLPLQLDDAAAAIVQRALEAQGIRFELRRRPVEVRAAPDGSRTIVLDDGRHLAADLVVVAAGVRPNLRLAESAGARVRSGVVVDAHLRTSLPDVYAAGDLVETVDVATGRPIASGTWTQAVEMGRCAADNMVGHAAEYSGALAVCNALDLAGLPVISVGLVDPAGDGYDVEVSRLGDAYRKLVFRGDRLVGALLVGNVEHAGLFTTLIRRQASAGHLRGQMLDRAIGYGRFLILQGVETDRYVRT